MTKIEAARRRRPSDELLSCILTGEPVLIAVVVKGKWRKWSRFFGFSISDQCMEVASVRSFSVSSVSTAARELCGDVRKPDISCKWDF